MYYNNKHRSKLFLTTLAFIGLIGTFEETQASVISEITFNNETSIALNTSIAGVPGKGIPANTTAPVSYGTVSLGCFWGGNMQHCGINFTNKANGELVATVYINADTATLTQPPVLYGNYATHYEVLGWESSPIHHITISEKV